MPGAIQTLGGKICQFGSSQESAVTDLKDLTFDVTSHLACQVKTGISLINRIAFRAGKVNEMTAPIEHLAAARLLSGFVGKVSRRHGGARSNGIATDVCVDKAHGDIFRQRIECAFG